MRKRRLWSRAASGLGAIALLWALLPASQATAGTPYCVDLMAGQSMQAGTVCVSGPDVSNDLTVTFTTNSSWAMTSVHLDVVSSASDFPMTKTGNPVPGKFPYAYSAALPFTSYTFTVSDPSGPTGTVYVAAHAVVWNTTTEQSVVAVSNATPGTATQIVGATTGPYSDPSSPQYAYKVDPGPTSGDAALANQPIAGQYPSCSGQGAGLGSNGLWNQGIGSAYTDVFGPDNAQWIWNEPGVIPTNQQISGQVVDFQQTFDVPGTPAGPGTLSIATDNAYLASVNGAEVGQARIGPGFPNTLMEDVGSGPQQGNWGVASQGWQQAGSYSFTPTTGANTLDVTAANEYQSSGTTPGFPADHYYGWTGSGYNTTVYNDPTPSDTGNGCTNPGGVIFAVSVPYFTQGETAWGAGTGFAGANWATYFTYTPSTS